MSNGKPRVSIGLPVYNGKRFIKEALDSILAQTFEDFELIISDNASTDGTQEICRAYEAKDRRIRYYRNKENLGAAWNYNRVFNLSTGEYFKWAAHDDMCAPDFLRRCVEVLDHMPSVVLSCPRVIIIDEHGSPIKNDDDDFNFRSPKPHERFKLYHKISFKEINAIFGVIRASALKMTSLIGSYPASDMLLLGKLVLLGEFYQVPDYLFLRRDHVQSSVLANPDINDRAVWFDPANRGRIQMPRCRWFFEYLSSIRQVRLSWYERTFCYIQMVIWFRWNLRRMIEEIISSTQILLFSKLGLKPGTVVKETRTYHSSK